jgi:hypothetical protein
MEKNQDIPKVTSAEVADWEEKFRKVVSPLVKFDKQDNGYSMKFYNGESGIDAYWSGTIILKADNYLKWNYSVLNGVFMDAKLNIDESNKNIPGNLYDFFKSWQEDVAKTMTEPGEEANTMTGTPADDAQSATLAGPESNNIPEPTLSKPDTTQLTEGDLIRRKDSSVAVNRKNIKRESAIMDSAERMRRLAGL